MAIVNFLCIQLRKNRDAEEVLMKDVEGWETGTWFGHPVYKVRCGSFTTKFP